MLANIGFEKFTPLLPRASQIRLIRLERYEKSHFCFSMFPFFFYFVSVIVHSEANLFSI